MTITECIEQRRSIRKYTEQEVEREKIEEVLRAALLAPSGKNRQPWKYLVYQSEEKEKLLDEMEKGLNREKHGEALLPESRHGLPSAFHTLRIMRQAPVLIVVLNTNAKSPFEEIKTDERLSEICDHCQSGRRFKICCCVPRNWDWDRYGLEILVLLIRKSWNI